ncbi:MAG: PocR ligand-binding domain-containing protein [Deltaproteobacteria bacterium]|nr:PocR ligand-binding domain-containing protein [Deltaproteobacteria bacterium]
MKPPSFRNRLKEDSKIISQINSFVRTTNIPLRLLDSKGEVLWKSNCFKKKSYFCNTIQSGHFQGRPCLKSHREAVQESLRWGEPIISKCCYFIMQIVSPVLEKGRLVGQLVASPFLLIDPSELQPEELVPLLRVKSDRTQNLKKALSSIPIVKDEEARQAAQRLFQLADRLSDPDLSALMKVQEAQILQGKIADQIRDLKDLDREFTRDSLSKLFYDQEKEIVTKIRLGDQAGAKEILCQLLAIILVQYLENFELLKISILELLIILSRAAVEAGAKIEEMLGMRYGFVTELASIRNQETLCLWVVKVFEKLTDQIYQTRNARNYQRLKRALDFIETNYGEPLTVDRVAKEVYLSTSRLSHIIKSELGITLGDYISKVRIEKAEALLKDRELSISQIALEVGFPDQSYFTKVFKKIEKCTPKIFRQNELRSA